MAEHDIEAFVLEAYELVREDDSPLDDPFLHRDESIKAYQREVYRLQRHRNKLMSILDGLVQIWLKQGSRWSTNNQLLLCYQEARLLSKVYRDAALSVAKACNGTSNDVRQAIRMLSKAHEEHDIALEVAPDAIQACRDARLIVLRTARELCRCLEDTSTLMSTIASQDQQKLGDIVSRLSDLLESQRSMVQSEIPRDRIVG